MWEPTASTASPPAPPLGEGSEMTDKLLEVQKTEVQKTEVQKTEVQKTEVREVIISPEDRRRRLFRSPEDGSPVITISISRSVGIPADESANVVAGLVPATSRIAIQNPAYQR